MVYCQNKRLAVIIFALTALFLLYEMALQVSPSIITPQLMQEFHVDALGLAILSSCYYYTYTAMQIPAGLLFDRFPPKTLILIALTICATGIALFGSAQTVWEASLARIFIGFGSAFAFVACLVIANQWFAAKHFALLAGFAQLLAALGAMGGQLPLAYAVAHVGWRNVMWSLTCIGVLIGILVFFILRQPKIANTTEASANNEPFWHSLKHVLKNSQIWYIAAYALIIWAPMTAVASLWGVPYLTAVYGFNSQLAASLCSLLWLGVGIGSPLLGWCSDYFGGRRLALTLSAFIGLIAIVVVLYVQPTSVWLVGIALFFVGTGSSGQALSFAVVKEQSEARHVATAAGFTNMAVVFSGAIFQPLLGWLISSHATTINTLTSAPHYSSADYQYAFTILPISYGIAIIISLALIRETFKRQR